MAKEMSTEEFILGVMKGDIPITEAIKTNFEKEYRTMLETGTYLAYSIKTNGPVISRKNPETAARQLADIDNFMANVFERI